MKIAILAKGRSLDEFAGKFDEVWGLNQICRTHEVDRLFVMDDLIHRMPAFDDELVEELKTYDKPIITSTAYEDWPTSESFPIEDVAKFFGLPFGIAMYSTVDYMLAYAIYKGVSEIHMFGVDCSSRGMELVRTSIAVWIGAALGRGIKVTSRRKSFSIWWTKTGTAHEHGLYGYVVKPRIERLT